MHQRRQLASDRVHVEVGVHVGALDDPVPQREDEQGHGLRVERPELALPLALPALTSPRLYHAAEWSHRVLGFNTAYWEANVVYHVVFSVAIPILLADLIFPSGRGRPCLGRTGLVVTALAALLGVAILRLSVPPSQDPGCTAHTTATG